MQTGKKKHLRFNFFNAENKNKCSNKSEPYGLAAKFYRICNTGTEKFMTIKYFCNIF